MAVDLWNEEMLTLTQAAKVIPLRNGRRPSIPTLWRWCRRGINGVRLDYVRAGRAIMTSKQAISRFFQALADADAPFTPPPPPTSVRITQAMREASLREADRILDEAGI